MEEKAVKGVMEALPCGVCYLKRDEALTILWANAAFYELYGYTRQEAEAAGFTSISFINDPADWVQTRARLITGLSTGQSEVELETRAIHRSGSILWVLARCRQQEPQKLLCTVVDVTVRHNQMEQLRLNDREKQLLLQHTPRFIYRYDISTHTAFLSPDAAREMGLPAKVDNMPDCLLAGDHVDPESLPQYLQFYQAMQRGEGSGNMVAHLRNGSGELAWYRCNFSLVRDREGRPLHTVVSFEDISAQREKEMAYEKWSQYNQAQLAGALGYFASNLIDGTLEELSQVEGRGMLPKRASGSYDAAYDYMLAHFVQEEDRPLYREKLGRNALINAYRKGEREIQVEFRRVGKGCAAWTRVCIQLLADPYTQDIRAFFLVKDIDEEKRLEQELKLRSQSDPLTGLLNRRSVIERVNALLKESGPSSRHVFLMVDIDHFKTLNDRFGHQYGDKVLVELAAALKGSLRADDLVGRLGGDEFILCLKDMVLGKALERKVDAICRLLATAACGRGAVSGSIGVAVYPKDGLIFEDLYRKADMALYQAKQLGRNRAVFYQDNMSRKDWKPYQAASVSAAAAPQSSHRLDALGARESESYLSALYGLCDELVEFNVTTNGMRSIYQVQGKYLPLVGRVDGLNDMIQRMADERVDSRDRTRFLQFLQWDTLRAAFTKGQRCAVGEFRRMDAQGGYLWVEASLAPIFREGQEAYLCLLRDIDAKRRAEEAERQGALVLCKQTEDECYRAIMEQNGTMLLEYDGETDSYYASAAANQFTLFDNVGKDRNFYLINPQDIHPEDWEKALEVSRRVQGGASTAEGVVRLLRRDGKYPYCRLSLTVLREGVSIRRSLITIIDVEEATRNRQALEYRAEYDDLTGYPNFSKFKQDAERLLRDRGKKKYSIWYCDIRNFKLVNDMYGYDVGDRVLKYWAKLGATCCRKDEVFARVSSDHFVSLHRYERKEELEAFFYTIAERLAGYGEMEGKKLRLELVTGIYLVERDEDILSVQEMMDRANLAQKSVKSLDGSRFAFYTVQMRDQLLKEKEIEAVMRKALAGGQFVPYLQPMLDLASGQVTGAEALVRWLHPEWGVVEPAAFVPLFEKNGFIVEMDECIFTKACQMLRHWLDAGLAPVRLAVNVSRVSVLAPDFISRYTAIKRASNLPDGLIELECTESAAVDNLQQLNAVMRRLHEQGFAFSMDDFGSGYSSLNLLKDVRMDMLKLDRIFLKEGQLEDPRNRIIVSSVVAMAKALHMRVVAEGVETAAQCGMLRQMGCDFAQGYLISRPIPAEEFEARFLQRK